MIKSFTDWVHTTMFHTNYRYKAVQRNLPISTSKHLVCV